MKSKNARNVKSKERKIHQCDTCGKTFHRREYLTQHIRIHTGKWHMPSEISTLYKIFMP